MGARDTHPKTPISSVNDGLFFCVPARGGGGRRRHEAEAAYTPGPPGPRGPPSPDHRSGAVLLLLLSDRIPAYELVLCGVKAEVVLVLYDGRGALQALLAQAERALGGRRARRLGLLSLGGTEALQLLHSVSLSEKTVLAPSIREFWEKLCGWVVPSDEGGGVDIFSPLAASATGVALMQNLSTLTGLDVLAPMGLATGSFQNILSQWTRTRSSSLRADVSSRRACDEEEEEGGAPALRYLWESVLQDWCRQAHWMEEALVDVRVLLGPRLQRVSLGARGRALGHFLWESVCLEELCVSKELMEALTEGLTALNRRRETRPLESLSLFLARRSEAMEKGGETGTGSETSDALTRRDSRSGPAPTPETAQMTVDWRGAVVMELYHSERLYLARLAAVMKVYHEPLTAALNSNRPIISSANIHVTLSPVAHILQLNTTFLSDLGPRLEQWGPQQCVGDVCVKLCSKLRLYINYFNNYPTALRTVDKCREMFPAFRAFLKRADRTMATHVLSLQELLLCPVWRMEEYVTLLQALSLHTHSSHPDHTHLSSALASFTQHREFIHKMKSYSERDRLMEETQKRIQGCPNLCEGNRQLIMTQDAALLKSPDEDIPDSLRTYEQVCDVGLFLFNDALVMTRRTSHHPPFSLAQRSTHTFMASVALACLAVREVTHSRYVRNAFILEGPRRSWACTTEGPEETEGFLCALRLAVRAAVANHR